MDSCSKAQPYTAEFGYIVFNNIFMFMKKINSDTVW